MTQGLRMMKALGYELRIDKPNHAVVRRFIKYDDGGLITDTINYFYHKETGVEVFINDLKNECGSVLNKELLNAVLINLDELDKYFKRLNADLTDFDMLVEFFKNIL